MDESKDRELLDALWSRYPLGRPVRLRRIPGGYASDTWIATVQGGGRVVVRRYALSLTAALVRFEHAVLRYLQRHRFPTPALVPAASGETSVELAGRHYAVFEFCDGAKLVRPFWRRIRPSAAAEAGRILGWLHRLMEQFPLAGHEFLPAGTAQQFQEELNGYRQALRNRQALSLFDHDVLSALDEIERQLRDAASELEPRKAACPTTIIHGDFGPSNILFRGGRISGVLDFTNARQDVRIAEVAYAFSAFSKRSAPALDLAMAGVFLRAYQGQNPLTEDELGLLARLPVYGRLRSFAWILRQYYSKGHAEAAQWFRDTVELIRWMQGRQDELRALCLSVQACRASRDATPPQPAWDIPTAGGSVFR